MTTEKLKPCDETWKDVPGWEDIYQVSDKGNVRCFTTGGGYRLAEPRIKTRQHDKDGYPFLLLYGNDKPKGLFNGMQGVITKIKKYKLEFDTGDWLRHTISALCCW